MEYKFYVKSSRIDKNKYNSPSIVWEEFKNLANIDQETFWILGLNYAHKAILKDCLYKGTTGQCEADPKLIFKRLLVAGCSSFIVIHNHPTGDQTPSEADNDITDRIRKISNVVGIELLDHVIIGEANFYSYKQAGTLN